MSTERFDIRHAPAPRESFRLLYISKSKFGGDWNSTAHTHSCTELFYCLSGEGQFYLSGQLYPVKPDDMIIVNPQVEHTELSLNASPLEYIVLGRCWHRDLIWKIRFFLRHIQLPEKSGADGDAAPYAAGRSRPQSGRLRDGLSGSAGSAAHLAGAVYHAFFAGRGNAPLRQRECVEIKRYLDSNYREDISLDILAEIAHINKYYLAHTFQKEYGISPITYLNRRRIEESKYMLGNTGYSLAQISELMGFSSPSYFSQCFRKAEGLTPNEYRRQVRQGQRPVPSKRHEA